VVGCIILSQHTSGGTRSETPEYEEVLTIIMTSEYEQRKKAVITLIFYGDLINHKNFTLGI
jgi:hypothetical protein